MSSTRDTLLNALRDGLAERLPNRVITRNLVVPELADQDELKAGLICVLAEGGGEFANYQGREGELGSMDVRLIALVLVPEDSPRVAVEQAEMELLEDMLAWCGDWRAEPVDSIYPGQYQHSRQMEHPVGWVTLALKARFV